MSLSKSIVVGSLAAAVAAAALTACAAPAEAGSGGVDVRILVKLVQPSADTATIAALASREAGVPAHYAAAVSTQWHALSLHCPDAAACDAAIARLRLARGVFESIEPDARKHPAAT